ncbi:MAG: tRNA (adenosine(37)-N6)-threonylcarbamoyltransferase complex ATPase subunit type 1 TsaE [Hyphomicrobiaceae bacterium]|nr:tRNA (adenosine(37)-N6)-threonylcarbamoyltransferase complex ATPase subunit type 1 TsaE [Hyphomicrobiaceae bacterium]
MMPGLCLIVDERGLVRVAELMALKVRAGDAVALYGDLGAGKTTFARAMIRALMADAACEVPSPTFALSQIYDSARMSIAHFDMYRLASPDEAAEIGFEEAAAQGLAIVEWPERVAEMLPQSRFEVHLEEAQEGRARSVRLKAQGACAERLARLGEILAFLDRLPPWDAARAAYLQGDASTRAYARLSTDAGTAILMDAPRQPDGPPVRDGKPYSQIAHLAEDVRPFSAIDQALRAAGISAPQIYAEDLEQGLLLTEDMGDRVFGQEIARGASQAELWRAAVDVLVHLRTVPVPDRLPLADGTTYCLPRRDRAAFEIEIDLLLDWYWSAVKGAPAPGEVRSEFARLWQPVIDRLLALPGGWFLRDFHSPNLLWLPERPGLARVGVIDFQDALNEHAAFDLVSLLQDARVDVAPELESALFEHYCVEAGRSDPRFDRDSFAAAYADFGAQRNTRLIGLWARLLKRDGKPQYLQHLPRTWGYLDRNLRSPHLGALRAWYEKHFPPSARRADLEA